MSKVPRLLVLAVFGRAAYGEWVAVPTTVSSVWIRRKQWAQLKININVNGPCSCHGDRQRRRQLSRILSRRLQRRARKSAGSFGQAAILPMTAAFERSQQARDDCLRHFPFADRRWKYPELKATEDSGSSGSLESQNESRRNGCDLI